MSALAQPDLFAGDAQRIIGTLSCGVGSYSAVRRYVDMHGVDDLTLVFTDTLFEDQDAYRFLLASAANLLDVDISSALRPAIEDFPAWEDREAYKAFVLSLRARAAIEMPRLIWLSDGRDPWDVYEDEGILGNSQRDPCARILKREMLDTWLNQTCRSSATQIIFGIDYEEQHRFDDGRGHGIRPRRAEDGWSTLAPLCDAPFLSWDMRVRRLAAESLWLPRLNALGFAHNNCGGACCKGGAGALEADVPGVPGAVPLHRSARGPHHRAPRQLRHVEGPARKAETAPAVGPAQARPHPSRSLRDGRLWLLCRGGSMSPPDAAVAYLRALGKDPNEMVWGYDDRLFRRGGRP